MNLVYSTAWGKDYYYELAQLMVFSLIQTGFEGEIIILTDREYQFIGAKTCVLQHHPEKAMWKDRIREVVDFSKYQQVLFVDTDIFFVKNPLPLFELSGIRCAEQDFIQIENDILNKMLLKQSEIKKMVMDGTPSINAGTVLFPAYEAEKFLSGWHSTWKEHCFNRRGLPEYWGDSSAAMYDQSALQLYLLNRTYSTIPREMALFPAFHDKQITSETVFIHFCGPKQTTETKLQLKKMMELCLEGKTHEAVKTWGRWRARLLATNPQTPLLEEVVTGLSLIASRLESLERKLQGELI